MLRSTLAIGDRGTILDLNVQLDIDHDRPQDLEVFLEHPQGLRVQLLSNFGGQQLNEFVLDDDAELPISAVNHPNIRTFRPETHLSVLEDLSVEGLWTLEIRDNRKQKHGILNSWSILGQILSEGSA
ncbi:proprotein convertase P-domain-containing protein [Oxynema sp. CENA135]|uniref:proprotein convertase P-domain-containing protein n=1 Tax=Oxynema sp. CENA135 TaxID=984206 RepID=UPI00351BFDFA